MRVELTAGRRLLGRQAGRTRGWRALLVVLAACAVTAVPALPAAFGQASGVTYSFSPQSGPAGTEITFSGTGCPPDPNVTRAGRFIIFRSVDGSTSGPLLDEGSFRPNADGSFSGRIESVNDGPLGPHRTMVDCTGGGASSGSFTLTAPAAGNLITEIEPICGAEGTARNILRMMTTQGLTGHVEDAATHETLVQFEQAAAGEKRVGVGKQYTVVEVKVDSPASGETHTVDFSRCNATTTTTPAVTSTTVAAGATAGTTGTGGTTATTTAPAATSAPVAAPASSAQRSLVAAAGQPAAALATTGSTQLNYFLRLAAASFMLGLLCMFITQRRRYRRIDAWLSYVFNNF